MVPGMNIICLIVDRLHAAYLGAYGNSWIRTPAIDRLAAEGFVFDHSIADTPCLAAGCQSYWLGRHAMQDASPPGRAANIASAHAGSGGTQSQSGIRQTAASADQQAADSLMSVCRGADVESFLLSDAPNVLRHPLAFEFDDRLAIEPCWEPRVVESLEETHFARCFAEIMNFLDEPPERFLLWAHLAGLGTVWDAPPEFREAYWDDEDPPPRHSADVPDLVLPEGFDPDLLLPITQAYAGQVTLLDACLGGLLELLEESPLGRDTALVLTSPRGMPLGEHRRVGVGGIAGSDSGRGNAGDEIGDDIPDEPIHGELIQVPLLVRLPGSTAAKDVAEPRGRSQLLVQRPGLWATLVELVGGDPLAVRPSQPWAESLLPIIRGELGEPSSLAESGGSAKSEEVGVSGEGRAGGARWERGRAGVVGPGGQWGLRTPAWYLRLTDRPQLYAKPEDRWEMNDVADRCREVVEEMLAELGQYSEAIQAHQNPHASPLSPLLRDGLE